MTEQFNRMRYERTLIKVEALVDDFKDLTEQEFNELVELLNVFLSEEKLRRLWSEVKNK